MKNIDLGQTITILANVGVIAGIVFLGIELRQNNRLLSSQAQYNLMENRKETRFIELSVPGIGEMQVKIANGEQLTPEEELKRRAVRRNQLLNQEYEYKQYAAGNLSFDELPVEAWRDNAQSSYNQSEWEAFKRSLDPVFVRFMDTEVYDN